MEFDVPVGSGLLDCAVILGFCGNYCLPSVRVKGGSHVKVTISRATRLFANLIRRHSIFVVAETFSTLLTCFQVQCFGLNMSTTRCRNYRSIR